MLNEFLYEYDDDQMESSMEALYTFFGIDDFTPATEAFANIKEKLKKIAEKIRNFIRKCIEWIRTKFYALLKIDTIKIDREFWKNSNILLNKLGKVDISPFKSYGVKLSTRRVNKAVGGGDLSNIKEKDSNRFGDAINTLNLKLENVKKDPIYNKVFGGNNVFKPENAIMVRVAPLAAQKAKLAKSLETLEKLSKSIESANTSEASPISASAVAKANTIASIGIESINLQIRIINKIYALGHGRNNPKDKNTKRLG